ncbi:MAG: UDP-N-acetylglucosamine 2-epimerase (non-hydrolyzing) [Terriglobales bacterium]
MTDSFTILNVVGARPNMMKMAPLFAEMRRDLDLKPILVHTGQHYDYSMSKVFFEQLQMPEPDYNLEVGSGSHHAQTAEVLKRFGELTQELRPDLIVVVGDVNSTMACALVGAKELVPVAHIEAGLRSQDRTMPEEINRVVTDAVSDLLFTTEESAARNLSREGVAAEKVFFVGNLMIDSLVGALPLARQSPLKARLGLRPRGYAVVTLHRPANVDDPERLRETLEALGKIAEHLPVIFPVHPRTLQRIDAVRNQPEAERTSAAGLATGGWRISTGLNTIPPASYLDFIGLVDDAAMVITDSGGIQEETTYLGIPCLTYRENTERPVTLIQHGGTNQLVGTSPESLVDAAQQLLAQAGKPRQTIHEPPPKWDGKAAPRIVRILRDYLHGRADSGKTADGQ